MTHSQIEVNGNLERSLWYMGFHSQIYIRRHWYYLQLERHSFINRWMDYTERALLYKVQAHYPHARRVRRSNSQPVYNLGTVFDFMQNIDNR